MSTNHGARNDEDLTLRRTRSGHRSPSGLRQSRYAPVIVGIRTIAQSTGTEVGTLLGLGTGRTSALVARVGLSLIVVSSVAVLLVSINADLAFASITLLLAVVGASTLGYAAGVTAALVSSGVLSYFFTPPVHSFRIDQPDDVLALVAFVTVSLVVGAVVARLNHLRRRSELAAREARVRLELSNSLAGGTSTVAVIDTVAREMVELFDLSSCLVAVGNDQARAVGGHPPTGDLVVSVPPAVFRLELGRALLPSEPDTIEALATTLAIALERVRLDSLAREQRVRADVDRSRVGFLTAVTHDLRTPLATIKGATKTLLMPDSRLDLDERRELLQAAYAESARLEGLVTKVLELTRIRSGAVQPEPIAVEAADLLQAAVERLGPAARGRRITLDLDPELPALRVDVLLMEHVLVNLVENALVHDPTEGEITIRGRFDHSQLELAMIDHGPGIPPRDRERVFEEFVRLRAPTDGPGSGLGLAIVRALVTASGGTVRCEETPGGGATLVLRLPVDTDERDNGPT
jgi:two-component system sensor histidine kinase KdpD